MGWVLLVGWSLVLVCACVLGSRPSTFAQLEEDLASGDATSVRATQGLSPSSTGYATVQLHWRSGLFNHRTEVVEAHPLRRAPSRAAREDVTAVVEPGVVDRLEDSSPGLRVAPVEDSYLSASFLGWRFPPWLGLVSLGLFLSTFCLLVLGPQPWRATRWAWFWLVGVLAPFGMIAYLLLGGPTSLVPPPQDRRRRLTGGWAFLLALILPSTAIVLG